MMARRRAKIPQNRLVFLWQKREAYEFVHRPSTDMGCRDVANIVHVETEERAQFRLFECHLDAIKTFATQSVDVDPLFPIDGHQAVGLEAHKQTSRFKEFKTADLYFRKRLEPFELIDRPHDLLHNVFAMAATASGVGTV